MKKYTDQEIQDLSKSIYKSILKSIKSNKRNIAQEVVRDVLDPNYRAEVDPDKIPISERTSVVNKSKPSESQEKGLSKLKKFIKKKRK